jgi:ABC-type glutathione transport system ATPase component
MNGRPEHPLQREMGIVLVGEPGQPFAQWLPVSLHPLYRVGWQIVEMIRAHGKSVSKREATERAVDLLRRWASLGRSSASTTTRTISPVV